MTYLKLSVEDINQMLSKARNMEYEMDSDLVVEIIESSVYLEYKDSKWGGHVHEIKTTEII